LNTCLPLKTHVAVTEKVVFKHKDIIKTTAFANTKLAPERLLEVVKSRGLLNEVKVDVIRSASEQRSCILHHALLHRANRLWRETDVTRESALCIKNYSYVTNYVVSNEQNASVCRFDRCGGVHENKRVRE
jgi:hypothetical protein